MAAEHPDHHQNEFQPLGRRPDELSQSQPEEIGDYKKTSTHRDDIFGRHKRGGSAHRRRQLLKALSEGTILLDPKRARRFASGYVEVNVQADGPSPPEEEMVTGRVLVHDPRYFGSGSSEDGSLNEEEFFATSLPVRNKKVTSSQDTHRSLGYSDNDDQATNWPEAGDHLPQPLAEEPNPSSRSLMAQKSFDSNASLPDTAGNYSDEFGSTSQVTVLQPHPPSAIQSVAGDKSPSFVISCDSDLDQHPPTPPPRRLPSTPSPSATSSPPVDNTPTTGDPPESGEVSETEKEIMVQFPPWPGATDVELIPAPPNFASTSGTSIDLEGEEEKTVEEEDDDFLPPPPPPEVLISPNKQMSERVLLRHLRHGSKSISETMTASVDSDSSGRRMTEHETSASSEPLSPTSELNSPLQEADAGNSGGGGSGKPEDSADNSDAFLTALSDHLTTTGMTEIFNTAMERSERSFRESDTSHNSTLRMDTSAVQDLPYESAPSPKRDPGAEVPLISEDSLPPAPILTSPDSNNDGPEFGRDSSTSGSYSLEATPCASLSPTVGRLGTVSGLDANKQGNKMTEPSVNPAEDPSTHIERNKTIETTSVQSIQTAPDRKTMKEGMKLQFLPGSSMFPPTTGGTASPSTTNPPNRSAGRRKHLPQQQSTKTRSSTDSDDNNEDVGDRSVIRKRRNNKNSAPAESADSSKRSTSDKNSKHKKSGRHRDAITPTAGSGHPDCHGGARKRDSQTEVTTPGMVRSPAMHEGFRMADWVAARSSPPPPPPPLLPPQIVDDPKIFTLQHPSESSFQDQDPSNAEIVESSSWNLMAPASSHHNCDSIRSASPGSDNVFVSETVEMSGNGVVVKPPEGFADSPAAMSIPIDWTIPSSPGDVTRSGTGSQPPDNGSSQPETKRKRDSGRGKRTKSCTLPSGNLSASGLSLETSGSDATAAMAQGPHRAVSTIDMWYPETQLPPKRQLTVRAKSEERDRWNRPGRRYDSNVKNSSHLSFERLSFANTV